MSAFSLVAIVDVLLVLALLEAHRRGSKTFEWIFKPLASTGFLVAASLAGALDSAFGATLFVGFVFSFFGDVLLIPRTRPTFLLGLISFLLGHVAYVVAFARRGVSVPASGLAIVGLVFVGALVLRWLLPSVDARMKPPVMAYVVVISAMVAAAVGTVVELGNPWILVGAVAFYLSDLSVARDRFVAPGFVNKTWGWPLYFGAQLVLAYCSGQP